VFTHSKVYYSRRPRDYIMDYNKYNIIRHEKNNYIIFKYLNTIGTYSHTLILCCRCALSPRDKIIFDRTVVYFVPKYNNNILYNIYEYNTIFL